MRGILDRLKMRIYHVILLLAIIVIFDFVSNCSGYPQNEDGVRGRSVSNFNKKNQVDDDEGKLLNYMIHLVSYHCKFNFF